MELKKDYAIEIIIIFPLRCEWIGRHKQLKDTFLKLPNIIQPSKCFALLLSSFGPLYRILFVLCSFSALFTSGYFYCFCILYLFLKIKLLYPILTAVRKSCKWNLSSVKMFFNISVTRVILITNNLHINHKYSTINNWNRALCNSLYFFAYSQFYS